MKKGQRVIVIDLIKAAACLMIFLYHCNSLLPGEWRWLTYLGDNMGNNLFFMASGFALFSSISDTPLKGLPRWYLRRLKRILPFLVLFYILSFVSGFYSFTDGAQLFAVFVYPSLYWFATGILYFYLLLFLSAKFLHFYLRLALCVCLFLAWFTRAGSVEAYYLIGFVSMLAGYMLMEAFDKKELPGSNRGIRFLLPVAGFAVFLFAKLLRINGNDSRPMLLLLGLALLFTGLTALYAGYTDNEGLMRFAEDNPGLYGFLRYIGSLALPVYLVQCFNAGVIGFTLSQRVVFPLSFAVNFVIVWGLAIIIERCQNFIAKLLSFSV